MAKESILYEIGYILKPTLSDEEILGFSSKLRNLITNGNGLINSEGQPKKLPLAYEIKKEVSTIFNWIKFTLNSDLVNAIERELKKDPSVLRFLVMKTKKDEPVRIPTLQPKREPTEDSFKTEIIATPAKIEAKEKIKEEEIDKKIEELLGE